MYTCAGRQAAAHAMLAQISEHTDVHTICMRRLSSRGAHVIHTYIGKCAKAHSIRATSASKLTRVVRVYAGYEAAVHMMRIISQCIGYHVALYT